MGVRRRSHTHVLLFIGDGFFENCVIGNTGLLLDAIVIGFTPIKLGGSWDSEAALLFETFGPPVAFDRRDRDTQHLARFVYGWAA
jgi:hypothetical protein